jgi:hypothetical protein
MTGTILNYSIDINPVLIIEEIYKIKNNYSGVKRSNQGGWQSGIHRARIIKPYEFMIPLIEEVSKKSKIVYADESISPFVDFWFNINGPGNFNNPHIHTSTGWAAVYYLQVPPSSGDIIFHTSETERYNFTPKENQLIVFPSNLRHEVAVNLSNQDRISVAFNF